MAMFNYLYDTQSLSDNSVKMKNVRVTEELLDEKIAEAGVGGVTEEDVDAKISKLTKDAPEALDTFKEIADALENDENVVSQINDALSGKADISDVYEKNEVYTKNEIDGIIGIMEEGFNPTHQDTTQPVHTKPTVIEVITSLGQVVDDVDSRVEEIEATYVTKTDMADYVTTSTLDEYAKTEDLPDVSDFVTTSTLDDYALKSELPDVSGFVTTSTLDDYALKSELPDVSDFVTTSTLESYAKVKDLPDMSEYYSKEEADETFLTEHQSLDDYALKSELPDMDAYYTKTAADEKFLTEHQSLENYLLSADAAETYQTKAAMTSYVDSAEYDSNAKKIYLKNGDTVLSEIDATAFVKDGMVDSVEISTPDEGINAGYPCLVISFNTDSGSEPIEVPISEIFNANNYYTKAEVNAAIEPLAVKSEVTEEINVAVVALNEAIDEKADKSDLDNYMEIETEESMLYDFVYDEPTWNNSFTNGVLKKYYEKYPDEDRWNQREHRWATAADKVNGEWPDYCVQCWEGAVNAPDAKFPWVCPNFNTDVNAQIVFKYDGFEDVKPWGNNVFGVGRKTDGTDRMWGIASVAEEFGNNTFLIPECAQNARPEWEGTPANDFDLNIFKMVLVKQDTVQSVKEYAETEINDITETLSDLATVAFTGSYNDLEDKPEPVSLNGYATENYVDGKVADLVNNAPEALNTLGEIATKLADNDDAAAAIVTQLGAKANSEDVYDKEEADELFVEQAQYDELNQKYTTLLNVVYSTATGDAATALNPDYVEASLSPTNTSVTITEGELGDVTIPETNKTYTVTAPMEDGANVNLSTPRAFNLVNTSNEAVDVTINVPQTTSSSAPTMSLAGDFDTLTVNNGSVGAKSGADPLTVNNLVVNNEQGKNATVSGVVFGDDATISSDAPKLGLSNNNTAQDSPSATINAEDSTVTLNKGMWNELTSNVSGDTLIVTQNAHINTLNIVKGNVIVNDREVANRIGNVVNETEYTISLNTHDVATGNELNSALTGNPGVVNVTNDITRGRITWGIFGAGNYLLDLKGHTVTLSDTSFGLKTRNTVNLKIVDSVGGGKFINDKSYGLWAGENTTITIDVPVSTEIIGVTHTLYCEGSGHPTINVLGGTYKMLVDPNATEAETYDPNGHYRFMLNHYDATYTREGNCFNITGGKFYNFNPMESYGEPGSPVNLLPQGYTVNHTVEDGVDVYEVVEA